MQKLLSYSFSVLFMFFALTLSAQSMSDDQVMNYIIKEHNSGTSQAQIVSNLMKQGVDINQIRRVRKKYEKEIQGKNLGAVADAAVDNAGQMMRQNTEGNARTQKLDNLLPGEEAKETEEINANNSEIGRASCRERVST